MGNRRILRTPAFDVEIGRVEVVDGSDLDVRRARRVAVVAAFIGGIGEGRRRVVAAAGGLFVVDLLQSEHHFGRRTAAGG